MIRTVVVCEAQVPFVRGGAEALVRELVRQLRNRGFDAERVSLPFKWYPKDEILAHAAAWRLLDLSESNGRPIDLLIANKVSDVPRAPSAQGDVARASASRRRTSSSALPTAISRHDERDVALRERLIAHRHRHAR